MHWRHMSGFELTAITIAVLGYALIGVALVTFIWFLIKTARAASKRDLTYQQLSQQMLASMQQLNHQQETIVRSLSSIEQRLGAVEGVLKQVE